MLKGLKYVEIYRLKSGLWNWMVQIRFDVSLNHGE